MEQLVQQEPELDEEVYEKEFMDTMYNLFAGDKIQRALVIF